MAAKPLTVDAYAAALPDPARHMLAEVRRIVAFVVPGVSESIRYQMPVFSVDGVYLVYAGAWKKHLGLYSIPALPADLETQIQPYRTTTDTVRFLYSQPIPYDLIQRLIEALVPIRRIENPGNHASAR